MRLRLACTSCARRPRQKDSTPHQKPRGQSPWHCANPDRTSQRTVGAHAFQCEDVIPHALGLGTACICAEVMHRLPVHVRHGHVDTVWKFVVLAVNHAREGSLSVITKNSQRVLQALGKVQTAKSGVPGLECSMSACQNEAAKNERSMACTLTAYASRQNLPNSALVVRWSSSRSKSMHMEANSRVTEATARLFCGEDTEESSEAQGRRSCAVWTVQGLPWCL